MHKRVILLSLVCFLMLAALVACGGTNSSSELLLVLPSTHVLCNCPLLPELEKLIE